MTTRPTNTSPPTTLDTAITTVLSESLLVSTSPSLAVLVVGGTDDTAVGMVGLTDSIVVILASIVVVGLAVVVAGLSVAVCGVAVVEGLADVVVGGGMVEGESVKRTAVYVHNIHRCRQYIGGIMHSTNCGHHFIF